MNVTKLKITITNILKRVKKLIYLIDKDKFLTQKLIQHSQKIWTGSRCKKEHQIPDPKN